jgi:hypothetical protein
MSELACFLLISAFLISGCGYTVPVVLDCDTAHGDTVTVSKLNEKLADKEVVLHTSNGKTPNVQFMAASSDSCKYIDNSTGLPVTMPMRSLGRIEYRNHVNGAIDGFFEGALIGFGAGAILGAVTANHREAGVDAVFAGFAGGMLGAVIGAVWHGISGERTNYTIPQDSLVVIPTRK